MNHTDIIKGLWSLGITEGDIIFVTSSLSRFGNVEGGAKTVVEALRECVGDGGIIMPSFNFSIFKKDPIILDIKNTPSEMGAITEAFRKSGKVGRTHNLFHPLCYEGVDLSKCDTYDTWGEGSPYSWMAKNGVKMVMLGTDFYSCPIFHYCEQRNNVPYREPIEYNGYVVRKWGKQPKSCRRLRRKFSDSDNNKVYEYFIFMNEATIGNAVCRSFDIEDMVKFLDDTLKRQSDYIQLQSELLSPMPTMVTIDKRSLIEVLFQYSRELTGMGFNGALNVLSKFIPLRLHNWKPKETVWNWTIPANGLRLGEYTVKGFSDETIILPIHLDHAGMANDNLSGVAVAMELIDWLQRTPDLKYSYKFLFVPETIGTIAYLSRFGIDFKYGIVFDSVGAGGDLTVTKSKTPSLLNGYITLKTNEFLSDEHLWSGNDERVLESVGIPSVQFNRTFAEYHTTLDTPSIIKEEKLDEAVREIYDFIKRIEMDFVPKPTYIGVPCLSQYDLWKPDLDLEKIWHLLHYELSISQIAEKSGVSFDKTYAFVKQLQGKRLIC